MNAGRSPKLSIPTANAPRMTVKLSHERKVRSLAKKTLGSTRVGRAMRLPAKGSIVSYTIDVKSISIDGDYGHTWSSLKKRTARHREWWGCG